MQLDNNTKIFFGLVKAGLWSDVNSSDLGILEFTESVDWEEVYRLAQEQSVQGVALQGLEWYKEHYPDCVASLSQELLLQWIGEVQMIEQQNKAMNEFVSWLIEKLRKDDVYAILVKGQGIAQCYSRHLWRVSGDVDLLLSNDNYEKAKKVLLPLATEEERELTLFKHIGMTINDSFLVELHGTLHCRLSKRVDRGIDEAQRDIFFGGNVRSWQNGKTQVFLPGVDDDVIFLFTHILKHFYQGGVGIRQICDMCRFLWTYREKLDVKLLDKRLHKMGILSEWKAFSAYMVDLLGMPIEAMPFYSQGEKWSRKVERINNFIMEVGNFGHNRDGSYSRKYSFVVIKAISLWQRTKDSARHFFVFPLNSIRVWLHVLTTGIAVVIQGRKWK